MGALADVFDLKQYGALDRCDDFLCRTNRPYLGNRYAECDRCGQVREIRSNRGNVLSAVADELCSEQAEHCRLSGVEACSWLVASGNFEHELEPLIEVMLDDCQGDTVRLEAIAALEGIAQSRCSISSSAMAKLESLALLEENEILSAAARRLLYKVFDFL